DIFVYDAIDGHTRQITKTADVESNPHFLRNGKRIYFTRSNNLFVMGLDTGLLVQMTDIRTPGAGGPLPATAGGQNRGARTRDDSEKEKGTDSQEFLKKEEKDLLETVRERAEHREQEEAKQKRENPRKSLTLQARQSVTALQLSPDEKYVVGSIAESG